MLPVAELNHLLKLLFYNEYLNVNHFPRIRNKIQIIHLSDDTEDSWPPHISAVEDIINNRYFLNKNLS